MFTFLRKSAEKANIKDAQIVFVQPNAEYCCNWREEDDVFDDKLTNYSQTDCYYLTYLRNREVWSDLAKPIFMTNSGYQNCTCSREVGYNGDFCDVIAPEDNLRPSEAFFRQRKSGRMMEHSQFEFINEDDEEIVQSDLSPSTCDKDKLQLVRSASYDNNRTPMLKPSRRVSILVDELLLKIYGGRERRCSGGTDVNTFEGSEDSSNNDTILKSKSSLLKKKRSFTGIPEDKCRRWNNMVRSRLMNKSVTELKTLKATLEYNVSHVGSQLIRQLKRRDFLFSRRDAQCSIITAFLQAVSAKRSEDMKIQFSMRPNAGESGFQQWHGAMKMVARLSGGIPREFRKTLWLTLAERHIISKNINWSQVEKTCFNDSTNPDDEELGIQIVKDLHRTGCSLFCGSSAEENQAVLKRVLLAYARWNKLVGYCQGFNMLAALILEVMDRCEQDSLKVMIFLIEGVLPESYFANNLQGLSVDMAVFRDLLRLKLPELSRHLEQLQTGSNDAGKIYEPPLTNVFTMQWFLTMFCNCLPHSTVLRVWDLIFLEGNQVLLKTALAIWDTLSDRIMPVKSADEFYSIMGVLTREMLEFGLMDANSLIKAITNIELSELTELRERYIYNITPWSQMARKGLRLFYGGDESDNSDDDDTMEERISEGAYGFLKAATKHGSQSIRSISPSSILGPFANEKEKIALDISALKKQYSKIKEHQRQAQIIFTAACNTHGFMGSMVPSTATPAINHLMLSKNTATNSTSASTKVAHGIQKPPAIPVSRAVQRLKETSSSLGDDSHKDRAETLYWDNRMKKRKRRRTEINIQENCCDSSKAEVDTLNDSDSSSSTTDSCSLKSSSSTELCDEVAEFDSEDANTSLSECCPSPLHNRLQSSTVSLTDDDVKLTAVAEKSDPALSKPDLPHDTSGYVSSEHMPESSRKDSDREKIFNLLLTTSIIASEQLSKQDDAESNTGSASSTETKTEFGGNLGTPMEYESTSQKRLSHFIQNINKLSRTLSDTTNSSEEHVFKTYSIDDVSASANDLSTDTPEQSIIHLDGATDENVELESALEHMKIDALEILFSSSTLNSIRNGNSKDEVREATANYALSVPSPVDKPFIKPFQVDEKTEIELREILQENTKLLKKVNQKYTYFDPIVMDLPVSGSIPSDENSTDVNYRTAFVTESQIRCDSTLNDPNVEIANSYGDDTQNKLMILDLAEKLDDNFGPSDYASNREYSYKTDFLSETYSLDTEDDRLGALDDKFFRLQLSPSPLDQDSDCKNVSPSDSSIDYASYNRSDTDDENDGKIERARVNQKKHKSLESLSNSKKKHQLKADLVSRSNRWISLSIDNSDLMILHNPPMMRSDEEKIGAEVVCCPKNENVVSSKRKKKSTRKHTRPVPDPYLYLNDDIIPKRNKKKKDPIEEYVSKKNILSQGYQTPPELTNWKFNPFPMRSSKRPPKDLGVKLGLYSSAKK